MEGEVPRARGRRHRRERRLMRRQLSPRRVERVDEDPVQPEVGRDGVSVRRVQVDRVRMRAGLPPRIGPPAAVLDLRRRRTEPAVGLDRQAAHAAAAVIGHQHVTSLAVDDQVARARAGRQLLVQQLQRPLALVDREGADTPIAPAPDLARLVDCEEILAAGMDRQERWVGRRSRQSQRVQPARADVQLHQVDPPAAIAPLAAGISPDVHPVHAGRTGKGRCLRLGPRDARLRQDGHQGQ